MISSHSFNKHVLPFLNKLPFAPFAEWLVAPVQLALVELAIELELPDIVAQDGDLSSIANKLDISHTENCAHILDAMTAAGLFHKQNGLYLNTELCAAYLRRSEPTYLGELFYSLKAMQHRNIRRLKNSLFALMPPANRQDCLHDEEHWKRSASGLVAYQKAGVADLMAEIAVNLPRAKFFRSMLDLGCGPGISAIRTLERLPDLHLVLCDFPRMLELAKEEAELKEVANRLTLLPGDYNIVGWGQGFDLIWSCQSLYYAKDLQKTLNKIFSALNPNGVFVSIHEGLSNENTEPAMLVLSRLSLALEGQDVSFVKGQIAQAAQTAGLVRIYTSSLPMLYGDAELEVFQKTAGGEER